MNLQHVIFGLLFYQSVGYFLSFGVIKHREVGRRYFLYHGIGLSILAAASLFIIKDPAENLYYWGAGFCVSSFLCSLFAGEKHQFSWPFFWIALVCGIASIGIDAFGTFPHGGALFPFPHLYFVNAFLSSLILGFTVGTMLLGHWYLIQPKLSIHELGRTANFMMGILVVRLLIFSTVLFVLMAGKTEPEIYKYITQDTAGMFLMMRGLWGLVAPFVLNFFILKTIQIRSTQSATGLLYVGVLFILVGEILSLYLVHFHELPV